MKLHGYLYRWMDFKHVDGDADVGCRLFVESLSAVRPFTNITGKHGVKVKSQIPAKWFILNLHLSRPIDVNDQKGMLDGFDYRVFLRVNSEMETVIFAANRYDVADAAAAAFNTYITPKLKRRYIRVNDLSKRLFLNRSATRYYITHLLADVPGYGNALRTLTLSGDDLAGARFFDLGESGASAPGQLLFTNFTARKIGLRPIDSRIECGRFGGNGAIEFSEDAIAELEHFLTYVKV